MLRWIMGWMILLASLPLFAAEQTTFKLDGCVNAKGHAVKALADPALNLIAEAQLDEAGPSIHYNPSLLPQLLPEARLFLFAHECARVYLEQSLIVPTSATEVREADCWAVDWLRQNGLLGASLQELEAALARYPQAWPPLRDLNLSACVAAGASRSGGLALPAGQGTHSDHWNACVQACGATLYRCGRSSSCVSHYDACVARCGAH